MEAYEISVEVSPAGILTYKSKNSCGQIMRLIITPEEYSNLIYWTIVLWVNKRKNGYSYMKQTGKDGIKSLLWAKSCVKHFLDGNDGKGKIQHIMGRRKAPRCLYSRTLGSRV